MLRSKDGKGFYVLASLLERYPKLSSPRPSSLGIATDIMHVLIHYLYTNQYQCLRFERTSSQEISAREFSTAVQVYALACDIEILLLQNLARSEMERLANVLHFSSVLRSLQDGYPKPRAEDTWLSNFLTERLAAGIRSPSDPVGGMHGIQGNEYTVAELLLKCMRTLVYEKSKFASEVNLPPATPVTETFGVGTSNFQAVLQQRDHSKPPSQHGSSENEFELLSRPSCETF